MQEVIEIYITFPSLKEYPETASGIDYIEVWISNIGVMNSKSYDLQSLHLLIWAKIRKHSQIIWKL